MGRVFMTSAQKRKPTKDSEPEDGSCDYGSAAVEFDEIESQTYGSSTNGSAKRKTEKTRMTYGLDDGIEAFEEHVRDADLAKISLEPKGLHF